SELRSGPTRNSERYRNRSPKARPRMPDAASTSTLAGAGNPVRSPPSAKKNATHAPAITGAARDRRSRLVANGPIRRPVAAKKKGVSDQNTSAARARRRPMAVGEVSMRSETGNVKHERNA